MSKIEDLLLVLPHGQDLSMPGEVICRLLEIDSRQLRQLVLKTRGLGQPVLSDDRGYYLPGSDGPAECIRFIRRMRRRALSSFRATRGAKRYIATLNQISMSDVQGVERQE